LRVSPLGEGLLYILTVCKIYPAKKQLINSNLSSQRELLNSSASFVHQHFMRKQTKTLTVCPLSSRASEHFLPGEVVAPPLEQRRPHLSSASSFTMANLQSRNPRELNQKAEDAPGYVLLSNNSELCTLLAPALA